MNKFVLFFTFLALIVISGLNVLPDNNDDIGQNADPNLDFPNESEYLIGEEFNIKYIELGMMKASWYGPRFHGRLTANGEIYDQMGFTAAHKSLPFGTLLRLTNPKNKKSVIVRINDRGPYIPGRQIDLSKKVAVELDILKEGTAKLIVEKIEINGLDSPAVF